MANNSKILIAGGAGYVGSRTSGHCGIGSRNIDRTTILDLVWRSEINE